MVSISPPQALRARLPGLLGKAFGNTGTLMSTQLAMALLRFASFPIILFFVDPADYGVMLAVGSLAVTLNFLSEMGLVPFTVRTEDGADPRSLDTVWTISVIRGVLIAAVMALSAPLVADAFGDERIAPALCIGALGSLLFECRSLGPAVAQRQQNERKNAVIRLGTMAIGLVIQVALAYWLRDWRALAWGLVAQNGLIFVTSFLFYPQRHRILFDKAIALALWRFSRMIAASSAVSLLVLQFDKYFVLAAASMTVAGLFNTATNLVAVPEDLIHRHARGVFLPIVAERLRGGERGPQVFYEPLRLVRPLLVLICCGGVMAGPAAIEILLPTRYAGVGLFLSLLSLRAALNAVAEPQMAFLLADDGQRSIFYAQTGRLIWTVGVGTLGYAAYGITGLVLAVALRELPPIIIQSAALARRGVFSWRAEAPVAVAAALGVALGALAAAAGRALDLSLFPA